MGELDEMAVRADRHGWIHRTLAWWGWAANAGGPGGWRSGVILAFVRIPAVLVVCLPLNVLFDNILAKSALSKPYQDTVGLALLAVLIGSLFLVMQVIDRIERKLPLPEGFSEARRLSREQKLRRIGELLTEQNKLMEQVKADQAAQAEALRLLLSELEVREAELERTQALAKLTTPQVKDAVAAITAGLEPTRRAIRWDSAMFFAFGLLPWLLDHHEWFGLR